MCAMYAVDVERRVSNISTIWISADSKEQAQQRALRCAESGKIFEEHEINQTFHIMNVSEARCDT